MKKIFPLFLFLATVLPFVGCDDDDNTVTPPTPEQPVLELNAPEITVSDKGGVTETGYTLTNPIKGAALKAVTSADWLSELTASEGKISFKAAANTVPESRTAVIRFNYPELKNAPELTVKQDAAEEVVPDPEISLNATEVNVPHKGGIAEMTYTLTNPVEGAELTAVSTAEWISDLNTSVEGKITFTVAPNELTEPRTTEIEMTYPGIKNPIRFAVNQEATPKPTTITPDSEVVTVPAEGGAAEMTYTLTNPVEGAELTAVSTAEWISDLNTSVEGKITFTVAPNEVSTPRSAIVELTYPGMETKPQFTVEQAAAEEKAVFKITLSNPTTNSFIMNLELLVPDMKYFYHVLPASAVAECPTDDDLYAYDVAFYEDLDASTGLGWQAWAIDDLQTTSIRDCKITNMMPDTEYVVYAYGVDDNLTRTTPITRATIRTQAPQMLNVQFNIELLSDTAGEIKAEVTAEDYNGYFVAKVFTNVDAGDTDEIVLDKISRYWADEVKMAGWIGYTFEQLMSQHGAIGSTIVTRSTDPGQKCYVYAFAVDENALRCSKITILPVTAK